MFGVYRTAGEEIRLLNETYPGLLFYYTRKLARYWMHCWCAESFIPVLSVFHFCIPNVGMETRVPSFVLQEFHIDLAVLQKGTPLYRTYRLSLAQKLQ